MMHRIARMMLLAAAVWVQAPASGQAAPPPTPKFHYEDTPPPGPGTDIVPPQAPGDPCDASVTERNGIVTLGFDDPARANQPTMFTLDEITYAAHFDGHGRLSARAPIFHSTADIDWTGPGGKACHHRGIAFSDFQGAVLTALVWAAGTVDLALHVVEPPNGRIGGPVGYVYPGRPNLDHAAGLGHLQTFGELVAGTSQVQLYSLPPERNPRAGDIYFFVEFVTRGNPARPPYCDNDAKAVASFKILHLDSGRLERRGGSFGTVACGTFWADGQKESGYFQRWKWKL